MTQSIYRVDDVIHSVCSQPITLYGKRRFWNFPPRESVNFVPFGVSLHRSFQYLISTFLSY